MKLTLVLLAASAAVVLGQPPFALFAGGECSQQQADCITNSLAQKLGVSQPSRAERAQMKQMMKAAKKAIKQTVQACFADAGCGNPLRKMKTLGKCAKGLVKRNVGPVVATCMDKQGVKIPRDLLAKLEQMKKGKMPKNLPGVVKILVALMKAKMGGKPPAEKLEKLKMIAQRVASAVCDNGGDAEAALSCVRDAAEAAKARMPAPPAGGNGPSEQEVKDAMRQAVMQCRGIACAAKLQQAKQAICTCATQLSGNSQDPELVQAKANIQAGIQQCKQRAGITASLSAEEQAMIREKIGKLKQKVCERPSFAG